MAIKGRGKTRKRGRSLAPRPAPVVKKVPFVRRRAVRRTALGVVALGALVIVMTVCGNISRSNTLEEYDRDLFAAQKNFAKHTLQGARLSIVDLPRQFAEGKVTPRRLEQAAATWERDFSSAAAEVRKLIAPEELRQSNEVIAQAIDHYVAVARMYVVAAKQRALATSATGRTKNAAEDQVQLILQQVSELRARADALYRVGNAEVERLKRNWGVEAGPTQPALPGADVPPPGGANVPPPTG